MGARPWSNDAFKSKNSSDLISARGCSKPTTQVIEPAITFVFAGNDTPTWESTPKGSEKDRIIPLYFPNNFLDEDDICTEPRCFPKDQDL